MRRAFCSSMLAAVMLFSASRALAIGFGMYGEWSAGGQTLDFYDGFQVWNYVVPPPGMTWQPTITAYAPEMSMDQSQWSLGFVLDTNVAKNRVFAYRLEVGYERATKSADSTPYALGYPFPVFVFPTGATGDVIGNGLLLNNTFAFGVWRRERFKLWLGPAVRLGFQSYEYPTGQNGPEFVTGLGVRAGFNYHVSRRITTSITFGYTYVGRFGDTSSISGEGNSYAQYGNMFGINAAVLFRSAGDQYVR